MTETRTVCGSACKAASICSGVMAAVSLAILGPASSSAWWAAKYFWLSAGKSTKRSAVVSGSLPPSSSVSRLPSRLPSRTYRAIWRAERLYSSPICSYFDLRTPFLLRFLRPARAYFWEMLRAFSDGVSTRCT